MFHRFGWKKVLAIYGEEPWGIANYEYFKSHTEASGVAITNPEPLRGIPFSVNRETIPQYDEHLL
jgi:hypothetical protein